MTYSVIAPDKRGYQVNIFLFSLQKHTGQPLYNATHYNMDSDITWLCLGSQSLGILQMNNWKMTISCSFSYSSFVKLSLYNTVHL